MGDANWREMYEDLSSKFGHLSDLGSDVFEVENVGEPRHTLSAAGSLAAAAEGLTKALEQDWALYTPQEAAAVAAALHATLQATEENLYALQRAVVRLGERGEIGIVIDDDETASDAVDRLGATADELSPHLSMLDPSIPGLAATPSTFQPPRTVHENMIAISEALGAAAQLVTYEDGHKPHETGNSCGCVIHLRHDGDLYFFDYSGLDWSLAAEKAGKPLPDGGKVWSGADMISLDLLDPLGHPRQIADAAREALRVST